MRGAKDRPRFPGSLDRVLPPLGQRIVKTAAAVFFCLLFYWLRGYRGQNMPTEAAITAIICMQPYVRDSRDYAISRFAGTLIGAVWGLLLLLLLLAFPALGTRLFSVYGLMALGVLASLYTAVLLRRPDASGQAAIVYLCLVITFPDIESPLAQMGEKLLGVLLGTVSAIAVNHFRLPRSKRRDRVFFVRVRDLTPDRFSQIPSAALYRLNYLCRDGAKICLISEHAPAFFMLQMNESTLRVPLIVMGGAAIYDAGENRYLHAETLRPTDSRRVREHLNSLGMSYFIYTVHGEKTRIFHSGPMREQEQLIFKRMKRSPYRDYLEEGNFPPRRSSISSSSAPTGRSRAGRAPWRIISAAATCGAWCARRRVRWASARCTSIPERPLSSRRRAG